MSRLNQPNIAPAITYPDLLKALELFHTMLLSVSLTYTKLKSYIAWKPPLHKNLQGRRKEVKPLLFVQHCAFHSKPYAATCHH